MNEPRLQAPIGRAIVLLDVRLVHLAQRHDCAGFMYAWIAIVCLKSGKL
jgi:hypothetical protein